ncbi:hypothetical protein [Paenibacillus medicaginis]|uniref:Uncharacterized protein n=1 Tax=Paenibacillus medicaginis TaxID=1470560 RepID=A0ABV5C174_9BACL
MPLDDLVASGKLDVSDLDDSSRAAGTFDEKLYGIVTGVNAQSVMYNPEIFEQTGVPTLSAGYTYEDLIQTARELKEQINQPDFIPIGSGALELATMEEITSSSQELAKMSEEMLHFVKDVKL